MKALWADYHAVCTAARKADRYELVEPLAWRHLQQSLRKLNRAA